MYQVPTRVVSLFGMLAITSFRIIVLCRRAISFYAPTPIRVHLLQTQADDGMKIQDKARYTYSSW